jgi:integrase
LLDNIPCTPPVKQSLSLEEVRRLYNTECSEPVVRKAALFSCLSGLRISDILNLKWDNVCSYADGGHYLDFECVKTKRQTKVPIGEDAYALIMPKSTDEYVFEGFNRSMTYGVMQQWLKACGITKHITFHCFRHHLLSYSLKISSLYEYLYK